MISNICKNADNAHEDCWLIGKWKKWPCCFQLFSPITMAKKFICYFEHVNLHEPVTRNVYTVPRQFCIRWLNLDSLIDVYLNNIKKKKSKWIIMWFNTGYFVTKRNQIIRQHRRKENNLTCLALWKWPSSQYACIRPMQTLRVSCRPTCLSSSRYYIAFQSAPKRSIRIIKCMCYKIGIHICTSRSVINMVYSSLISVGKITITCPSLIVCIFSTKEMW